MHRDVSLQSWTAPVHQVASIDDVHHVVSLKTLFNNMWAGGASGNRYFCQNWLEALDQPGEFYYDRCVLRLPCS